MELLAVWRQLVRARYLAGVGVLVAVAAGLAAAGMLPGGPAGRAPTDVGMARVRVLVDTPKSLITDLSARADSIGAQAELFSELLTGEPQAQAIARAAGVPRAQLVVRNPASRAPVKVSEISTHDVTVASSPGEYTVTLDTSTSLPIITMEAVAPDKATAAKLTAAATSELTALVAARAPDAQHALSVKQIDPVRAMDVVDGGRHRALIALLASVFVLALWCGAIVIAAGALRAWRGLPAAA